MIVLLQDETSLSERVLAEATECLTQAVNLSLQKGLTDIARLASLEIVECIGQYDPVLATSYLTLHQVRKEACSLLDNKEALYMYLCY